MTVATARALLRPPLTFGDPEQIRARDLVRKVEDCKEAIRGCERRHLRELARLGPGKAALQHWARKLAACDCVYEWEDPDDHFALANDVVSGAIRELYREYIGAHYKIAF